MNSSKISSHLKVAKIYAELSHATRLKVGAVIIKDDRPISVGRNGTPSGYDNTCEYLVGDALATRPEVIHAEANAIAFAAKNGVSTDGCDMVLTHSPCYDCSKLIIQCGIKNVYYEERYRITDSIEFLANNNINVIKIGD
jgi:dCMP deaminase